PPKAKPGNLLQNEDVQSALRSTYGLKVNGGINSVLHDITAVVLLFHDLLNSL
ncbi:hypothetical protein SDJN02_19405, partial [Cucurbita argyrosperma subsp. argyrosperma]